MGFEIGTKVRIVAVNDRRYDNGDEGVIAAPYGCDNEGWLVRFVTGRAAKVVPEPFVFNEEMEAIPALSPDAPAPSPALRLLAETLVKLTVREMAAFMKNLNANTSDGWYNNDTMEDLLKTADAILAGA